MLGAIVGDIIGSVYEFNNTKRYNFNLFTPCSNYTDDSIMSIAVAQWLLEDEIHTLQNLEDIMVSIAKEYPCPIGGYGGGFNVWLFDHKHLHSYEEKYGDLPYQSKTGRHPYGSWGNGSAMRASACGWFFDTLEETERIAALSAIITHNHPEGIKGAQATAAAIWLARKGKSKVEIKDYITLRYDYDLNRTYEYLNLTYKWESSCQGTVPEAIIAFLESDNFEDAMRKAVSMGGDSDTLACITGGIAEAFYGGVPEQIGSEVWGKLPDSFKNIISLMADKTSYGKVFYGNKTREQHINAEQQKYYNGTIRQKYTPENIAHLLNDEVFVFGSNLKGAHNGGAAYVARKNFGARMGCGVGIQGRSFAIPTMQGGVETIRPYVEQFLKFAKLRPELYFYVTRIGCGIAGFTDKEIAPLFRDALKLDNVSLPKSFVELL